MVQRDGPSAFATVPCMEKHTAAHPIHSKSITVPPIADPRRKTFWSRFDLLVLERPQDVCVETMFHRIPNVPIVVRQNNLHIAGPARVEFGLHVSQHSPNLTHLGTAAGW